MTKYSRQIMKKATIFVSAPYGSSLVRKTTLHSITSVMRFVYSSSDIKPLKMGYTRFSMGLLTRFHVSCVHSTGTHMPNLSLDVISLAVTCIVTKREYSPTILQPR